MSRTVQVQEPVTEAPVLMAWQFKYLGGFAPHNFETMPFYKQTLRDFLRQHVGKIVWIKGALIEQPAYLIFYEELKQQVYDILLKPLQDGGRFGAIPIKNPIPIIRKYLHQTRLCHGCLDLKENGKIGSISSIHEPTDIDYLNGFWFNSYLLMRANDGYQKLHEGNVWVCLIDAVEMGVYPDGRISYTHHYPEFWFRKSIVQGKEATV